MRSEKSFKVAQSERYEAALLKDVSALRKTLLQSWIIVFVCHNPSVKLMQRQAEHKKFRRLTASLQPQHRFRRYTSFPRG